MPESSRKSERSPAISSAGEDLRSRSCRTQKATVVEKLSQPLGNCALDFPRDELLLDVIRDSHRSPSLNLLSNTGAIKKGFRQYDSMRLPQQTNRSVHLNLDGGYAIIELSVGSMMQ